MAACGKEDRNEPSYGRITCDGQVFNANTAMVGQLKLYPLYTGYSMPMAAIMLSNVTSENTGLSTGNCGIMILTSYPLESFRAEVGPGVSVSFYCKDKSYYTHVININRETGGVTSIGIDPKTGLEKIISERYGEPTITGGTVAWTVGRTTGRLEFHLELEGGVTASGYGDIPLSLLDKY